MEPQDDPEARIRALEQPLAGRAQPTELGTTPYTGGGAYQPPPVPPMPPQAPGYGDQYTPPGYGAPWAPPPRKSSAGIPWVVLGVGALVFMVMAVGVGFYVVNKATRDFPVINMPSFPSIPSVQPSLPGGGPANTVQPAPPGGQLSVAGVGENKTIACNESHVSVSGVSNTVTITGHCADVTVSGMQNKVTLEASNEISASGLDNVVTYHSGSPDINSGGSNVVQQG